jgi:high affinity Mn2+ porin
MKFSYLIGIASFCASGAHRPASGADLPIKAPASPTPFDWAGFYFGGHVGYATGASNWQATEVGAPAPALGGSVDLFNSYDAFKGTGSFFHGLQAGYNHMFPSRLVVGFEADLSAPNTLAGNQTISSPLIGQADYRDTVLLSGTARGRVGYAFDHWIAYGTGGFAWSYDQLMRSQTIGIPAGGSASGGPVESAFLWRFGWTAGAGVEVPITPKWTAKAEYLVSEFGRGSVTFGMSISSWVFGRGGGRARPGKRAAVSRRDRAVVSRPAAAVDFPALGRGAASQSRNIPSARLRDG